MVLLTVGSQDAVEAGFRGEVAALVREAGHDLAGRQALEGLAVAGVQHGLAFLLRQLVARCRPRSRRAAVLWRAVPGAHRPGPCREFRVWAGMMGAKEPRHAATQRADDP